MTGAGSLLRVALFTPLPPARTGTADYAASLIEELNKLVKLDVFSSGTPRSIVWRFNNPASSHCMMPICTIWFAV